MRCKFNIPFTTHIIKTSSPNMFSQLLLLPHLSHYLFIYIKGK